MKTISNEYYEVKSEDGISWGLAEKFETLQDAIKGGEEMNRAEAEDGYKPTAWIITKTMWCRTLDDNGKFLSESSATIAMSLD